MYYVMVEWFGEMVRLPKAFATRGDAEWALGRWRAENKCQSDAAFRIVQTV